MSRPKSATVWLAGCSGCHMSFLDLDEWLIELAALTDIVYSPFVDAKTFPDQVDMTLVEGAVSNEENLALIRTIRARSRLLIAFGDCAVTGNVTAMRNTAGGAAAAIERGYGSDSRPWSIAGGSAPEATLESAVERTTEFGPRTSLPLVVPHLLPRALPVHHVVPVDGFLPGCPPPAGRIRAMLELVLRGDRPILSGPDIRFG